MKSQSLPLWLPCMPPASILGQTESGISLNRSGDFLPLPSSEEVLNRLENAASGSDLPSLIDATTIKKIKCAIPGSKVAPDFSSQFYRTGYHSNSLCGFICTRSAWAWGMDRSNFFCVQQWQALWSEQIRSTFTALLPKKDVDLID